MVERLDVSEEVKDHNKLKELLSSTQVIEELIKLLEKYMAMVKNCF